MNRIAYRLFISLAPVALAACGSSGIGVTNRGQERVHEVVFPPAMERERQALLPHLHYSLDVHSIDWGRGTVELSFHFEKEQGDSVLWVECVERVPLALVDTALCRRWFSFEW